jgi:hypothetical protein
MVADIAMERGEGSSLVYKADPAPHGYCPVGKWDNRGVNSL